MVALFYGRLTSFGPLLNASSPLVERDSYTPLASQYSCLEGNQNTLDAIQSRLPLSGVHQEVFSIIMFLQNKFHWEAFHHPECMGCSCNLKAWRVFFLSALLIFSTKMRKKTEKYLHQ